MRVISLFSGAGGLDLGFKLAGFEIVWANDVFADAVGSYRRNIGNHIHLGDIRQIDPRDVPQADVLIGGFPCQGFSVANVGRHGTDERNLLYREFLRFLVGVSPRYFVAENVKGILSLDGGAAFARIVGDFEGAGYGVQHAVLNAANFGVPQRRERVFIVGTRADCSPPRFPPEATHATPEVAGRLGRHAWVTVKEALMHVPEPDQPHNLSNHDYSRYKLTFNGYLGHRVIDPDQPAPTVTARGDDRGGVVVLHHPSNRRRMSARELAAVQSFPLDFEFVGTRTSAYRQIANAVPPMLARAVASAIWHCRLGRPRARNDSAPQAQLQNSKREKRSTSAGRR